MVYRESGSPGREQEEAGGRIIYAYFFCRLVPVCVGAVLQVFLTVSSGSHRNVGLTCKEKQNRSRLDLHIN